MAAESPPRPLAARLGLDPATAVRLVDLPSGVARELAHLPAKAGAGPAAAIVCAVVDANAIARHAHALAASYAAGGRLWLLYPKRSGAIRTDISRDHGWQPLLALGFVPVQQVAVDDDWSALRFRRSEEVRSLTRKTVIGGGAPRR